jgi:hypothetical protein
MSQLAVYGTASGFAFMAWALVQCITGSCLDSCSRANSLTPRLGVPDSMQPLGCRTATPTLSRLARAGDPAAADQVS